MRDITFHSFDSQQTITDGVYFFWNLEYGFVGKQKGNEKQKKGKAYNLMQCDKKTRTGGFFFCGFFFWILVLLKNRSRSRVLILLETNGI